MKKYIILLLLILPLVAGQDYLKLKYFYQPKEVIVEQGRQNETFIILQNTHNQTIFMVSLKYSASSEFSITQKEIEEMQPSQKKSLKFNISTTAKEGIYNITIWAESIDTIENNKIQGPRFDLPVIVIKGNQNNKTTIVSTTTSTTLNSTTTTTSTTSNITKTTIDSVVKKTIDPKIRTVFIIFISILIVALLFMMLR